MGARNGARRVSAMLAGIVLASLVLAASVQAGPGRRLPCPRKGAQVIAKDKLMLVYRYPPAKERFAAPGRTEACLTRSRARMTLFDPEQQRGHLPLTTFTIVAVSGAAVVYSIGHHGVDSGNSSMFVANVASRRIIRELPGEHFVDAGILFRTRRTDLALSPSGSVAWIVEVGGAHEATTFVVRAAPVGGKEVVLDEGPDIAPHSLELRAGTLRWQDAGMQRAAPLNP